MEKIQKDELKKNKIFDFQEELLALTKSVKADKKDPIELELGDVKDATKLYPQAKVKRWNNEVNLSIRYKPEDKEEVAFKDSAKNTLKWSGNKKEIHIYEKPDVGEDGGLEIEAILEEKPEHNYLDFTIQTKGLDFFYQGELTEEEKTKLKAQRPDNVVGSYAVYHKEKSGNYADVEYKTGKFCHIYRPKVVDKNGDWIWGDLEVREEEGILRVTIDKEWLEKAVYPVVVDPTIGYTSVGGSNEAPLADSYMAVVATATEMGDISSISVSAYRNPTSSYVFQLGVYDSDGDRVCYTGNTSAITSTKQWWTANVSTTDKYMPTGTTYIGYVHNDPQDDIYVGYDDADGSGITKSMTFGTWLTNLGSFFTFYFWKPSIYATYTAVYLGSSERAMYLTGRTSDSSEKSLYLTGSLNSSSGRGLYVQGLISTSAERGLYIAGVDSGNSERNLYLTGCTSDSSERSLYIKGSLDSSSERALYLGVVNTSDSERVLYLEAIGYGSSEVAMYLSGVLEDSSERNLYLQGKTTGSNERTLYTEVVNTESSSRNMYIPVDGGNYSDRFMYLSGKDTSSSERGLYVTGGYGDSSERSLYLEVVSTSLSERALYVGVVGTDFSERSLYLIGSIDDSGERNLYLEGFINENSERSLYLTGSLPGDSERNLYLGVVKTGSSERSMYLGVVNEGTSERNLYLTGGLDDNSERLLYFSGKDTSSSDRNLYLTGSAVNSSERSLSLEVVATGDSQRGLYITGCLSDNGERTLHLSVNEGGSSERGMWLHGGMVGNAEMYFWDGNNWIQIV